MKADIKSVDNIIVSIVFSISNIQNMLYICNQLIYLKKVVALCLFIKKIISDQYICDIHAHYNN